MSSLNLKYKLNWQDRSFIKTLPKNFRKLSPEIHKRIEQRAIEIFNGEGDYIKDKQSQSFLIMCSYMASYYEYMKSIDTSKPETLDQLRVSLIKSAGGKYVTWLTRIMLWIKKDKRKFIEKSSIDSKKAFGTFLKMREEKEEYQFTSVVDSCGIHLFFKRYGMPELTKVFCAWDGLWANEINKQNCGITFQRPMTIADGDKQCRFEFRYVKK
ncbi:MAG: L-2-amino-thiazoline-4-carboxylic acid hydrolase [Flavobacteriaceae bacterium]